MSFATNFSYHLESFHYVKIFITKNHTPYITKLPTRDEGNEIVTVLASSMSVDKEMWKLEREK